MENFLISLGKTLFDIWNLMISLFKRKPKPVIEKKVDQFLATAKKQERILDFTVQSVLDNRYDTNAYKNMYQSMIKKITDSLVDQGCIKFTEIEDFNSQFKTYRATIRVVVD